MRLSEKQVVEAIRPMEVVNPGEREFLYFTFDSRRMQPGGLFFALKGQRDGHLFVEDALKRGGLAAVVERKVGNYPQFVVKNSLRALGDLAASTLGGEERLGITGSAGKTTTKFLLYRMLSERFSVEATPGNWNNLIGIPTFLLNRTSASYLVLEMGISIPGEMDRLVEIARPTAAVITRIYPVHTETLGDVEKITGEKGKILRTAKRAAFNLDDPNQKVLMGEFQGERRTFSRSKEADIRLLGWRRLSVNSLHVEVNYMGRAVKMDFPFWSPAFLENLLAAMALSSFFIHEPPSLDGVEPLEGRGRVYKREGLWIIDESYNSNPSACLLSLLSLSSLEGRKIAVLSDMLELKDPEEEHREFGKRASMIKIDLFILAGPWMKFAFEEMSRKRDGVYWAESPQEATNILKGLVRKGDIVFFKGSHGTGLWKEVKKWT